MTFSSTDGLLYEKILKGLSVGVPTSPKCPHQEAKFLQNDGVATMITVSLILRLNSKNYETNRLTSAG